ncbi:hypothetical protein Atai01_21860 [Amycolatopsis taiwanensis]|uniref:Uncharacterized protein n=1 Tax=Amycolatopsis taiwanensis TaxID=342230 RepID=A0A9W6R0U0_9PSEU|nr:hypothetical protein Atai01_21860 [Amycolatopsis taiwanensis]
MAFWRRKGSGRPPVMVGPAEEVREATIFWRPVRELPANGRDRAVTPRAVREKRSNA